MTTLENPKVINECPVLERNLNLVLDLIRASLSDLGFTSLAELDFERMGSAFDADEKAFLTGIYNGLSDTFFKKHHIPISSADDLIILLDQFAFTYLSSINGVKLKATFDAVDNYFERLDRAITRMELLLVPEVEKIEAVMKLFYMDNDKAKPYGAIVREHLSQLENLKTLRRDFRSSPMVEKLSFTQKHSIKYPGLDSWMKKIIYLWCEVLGRSIENKFDGINGRKHLLDFALDCMEFVQPSLEHHTLDNMLRKIQNSPRRVVKD